MSKPVASGPYKGILPFLCIEGVSIAQRALRLVLSNEIVNTRESGSKIINFGNFVFFSSNKAVIENLNVSNLALKEKISREQQNLRYFSLNIEKDFKYKAYIDESRNITILNQTYNHDVPMDLHRNKTNDLYVLVASFSMDSNNNITIGSVLKETLLKAGRPPLESDLYMLGDSINTYGHKGTIWPASVHDNNVSSGQGSLVLSPMAGRHHASSPHPVLLGEKVINVKSKDLRILRAAAEALPAIVTSESPSVANNPDIDLPRRGAKGPLAAAESKVEEFTGPLGYFSPLHLSRFSPLPFS